MPTSIEDLRKQYASLEKEREQIKPIWKQLADNFFPVNRTLLNDSRTQDDVYERMGRINSNILDSTPIKAVRTMGAGMQSGITSPAKRWFKQGHPDSKIEKLPAVKEWLEDAQQIIFDIMARSDFYNNTHNCYVESGVFGTLVLLILEDDKKTIRTISLSAGVYLLSTNFKGEIDTLFRDIQMTAEQMVDEFGEENVSLAVRNAYDNAASKGSWFPVVHVMKPNPDAEPGKEDVPGMAYESVYFEKSGADKDNSKVLRRGGFRSKPFVAARWSVTGESVYGNSPAMDVLAFAKGLQSMTTTLYKVKQKNADPPLNIPPNMKSASTRPGARNYMKSGTEKITATVEIKGDTNDTQASILDLRSQILEGLFNDVFRALGLVPFGKATATEIVERTSEGLRLLGPVLERLQFEFLDPIIDRIFSIALFSGLLPEPPEELEGTTLTTEYISPLAQAQKAVGTESFNQLIGFTQVLASLDPTVLDNLNFDEIVNIYADLIGVSPKSLNDEETIRQIRELREAQQAAAIAQENQNQEVENLKKMSETNVTADTNAIESLAAAEANV